MRRCWRLLRRLFLVACALLGVAVGCGCVLRCVLCRCCGWWWCLAACAVLLHLPAAFDADRTPLAASTASGSPTLQRYPPEVGTFLGLAHRTMPPLLCRKEDLRP